MALGFILKSPGTLADPADAGSYGPGISVFGTIHPDIFRLGSGPQVNRIRLASLEPQIIFDAPINGWGMRTDTSATACRNASLEERFAALGDRPASFDGRFAVADDCPDSFDESLASAMQVLASSLRSPPDQVAENPRPDAAPKPTASKPIIRFRQARKVIAPQEDDGRIAIYDITARTVYLPSGRRLEAHSGLGELMDNPRYAHVRMRGVTPPNVYNLALRERLFHGVRAIRLNPVDDDRMHGRAGILAHTYMLGGNGQSNGCVSFRDYTEFLNAYLRGEITRLVVVDRLDSPPGRLAAGQLPGPARDLLRATDHRQYASAGEH